MPQKAIRLQFTSVWTVIFLVLLFAGLSLAQSDAGAGALRGTVSTADGHAAVRGVTEASR